jgi:hypothetical protein
MRGFLGKHEGWRPIEEAPSEVDVELFVTDRCGSFYGLRCPCRRTMDGWVNSATGTPLAVTPVKWKPLNPLRSRQND